VFVVVGVVCVVVVAIGGGKGEGFAIFVQKDRRRYEREIFRESNNNEFVMCKVIVYVVKSVITTIIIFSSCF